MDYGTVMFKAMTSINWSLSFLNFNLLDIFFLLLDALEL